MRALQSPLAKAVLRDPIASRALQEMRPFAWVIDGRRVVIRPVKVPKASG